MVILGVIFSCLEPVLVVAASHGLKCVGRRREEGGREGGRRKEGGRRETGGGRRRGARIKR
jgi:hypothetical protein